MKKPLVTYFSATGNTKKLATIFSEILNSDIFEIEPTEKYTKQDLDWTNKKSRSSLEMNNPNSRPTFMKKNININEYDVIFIGFPIWWYTAPRIINSFLESYDFAGKTIVPFATSGSSEMDDISEHLKKSCSSKAIFKKGKRFSDYNAKSLKKWVDTLDI